MRFLLLEHLAHLLCAPIIDSCGAVPLSSSPAVATFCSDNYLDEDGAAYTGPAHRVGVWPVFRLAYHLMIVPIVDRRRATITAAVLSPD